MGKSRRNEHGELHIDLRDTQKALGRYSQCSEFVIVCGASDVKLQPLVSRHDRVDAPWRTCLTTVHLADKNTLSGLSLNDRRRLTERRQQRIPLMPCRLQMTNFDVSVAFDQLGNTGNFNRCCVISQGEFFQDFLYAAPVLINQGAFHFSLFSPAKNIQRGSAHTFKTGEHFKNGQHPRAKLLFL